MNAAEQRSKDVYFASVPAEELADQMRIKIQEWRKFIESKGLLRLWSMKLQNYYGNSLYGNSSQMVASGGSEGELSLIKVNDLRNLIQNQLVMVTSQRPAGQARAINSNTE